MIHLGSGTCRDTPTMAFPFPFWVKNWFLDRMRCRHISLLNLDSMWLKTDSSNHGTNHRLVVIYVFGVLSWRLLIMLMQGKLVMRLDSHICRFRYMSAVWSMNWMAPDGATACCSAISSRDAGLSDGNTAPQGRAEAPGLGGGFGEAQPGHCGEPLPCQMPKPRQVPGWARCWSWS